MSVRVVRLQRAEGYGALRAWVDLEFGEAVRINECRIVQKPGQQPYLAPPTRRIADAWGKGYVDLVQFVSPELVEEATEAALRVWRGQGSVE